MPRPMTQTHIMACQLCPADEIFQFELTDPSDRQYKETVAAMFTHLIDVHGEDNDQLQSMKQRATRFADGANGYARQHWIWFTDDGAMNYHILVAYQWTKERAKK